MSVVGEGWYACRMVHVQLLLGYLFCFSPAVLPEGSLWQLLLRYCLSRNVDKKRSIPSKWVFGGRVILCA